MKVMRVLREFRKVDELSTRTILVFLAVCAQQGISQSQLAEELGLGQSMASRLLKQLSAANEYNPRGLGWIVAEPDPAETRRKLISLTAKGKMVCASIHEIMKGE